MKRQFINYENYIKNYEYINTKINTILSRYILKYNDNITLHLDNYIKKLLKKYKGDLNSVFLQLTK